MLTLAILGPLMLGGCYDATDSTQAPFQLRGDPINPVTVQTTVVAQATASALVQQPTPALSNALEAPVATTNFQPAVSNVSFSTPTSSPAQRLASIREAPIDQDGFKTIGFEQLSSYAFEVSDEIMNPSTNATFNATARTEAQIPREIKALDKTAVALRGFMLPLKVEGGLVTELLIMKDQSMCCFGAVPKINEWVSVKMVEKGVKPIMDQPITLFGKLSVGEMRENGYLVGIYSMAGEKMAGPLDN